MIKKVRVIFHNTRDLCYIEKYCVILT